MTTFDLISNYNIVNYNINEIKQTLTYLKTDYDDDMINNLYYDNMFKRFDIMFNSIMSLRDYGCYIITDKNNNIICYKINILTKDAILTCIDDLIKFNDEIINSKNTLNTIINFKNLK